MFAQILNSSFLSATNQGDAMMTVDSKAMREDLIMNPTPRCPCVLVLDTSGSMDGSPLAALNEGVQLFLSEVKADEMAQYSVEVGVVTAGGVANTALPISPVRLLDGMPHLSASGTTPLGAAVEKGLTMLEERKNHYKQNGVPYYQPWMLIISDGAPTDSWQSVAAKTKNLAENRKLVVMSVGVDGADLTILSAFSNRDAKALGGLKFKELFQWLSASMSRVSASASTSAAIALPSTNGWDSI